MYYASCFLLLLASLILLPIKKIKANSVDSLQYAVIHYMDDNGLPQNSVKFITHDENGFLWMATENGLVRFDGKRFKNYSVGNLSLTSNRISYIYINSGSGQLSARTDAGEIIDIRNSAAWLRPAAARGNCLYERLVLDDVKGRLPATGIPHFYPSTHIFKEYLILGKHNCFYVITKDSLLVQMPNGCRSGMACDSIDPFSFFTIQQQLFYINPSGQIFTFDGAKLRPCGVQGRTYGYHLYWNAIAGQVFLYADERLYLLEREEDGCFKTTLILNGFDLEDNRIICPYYDKDNARLFLGSHTQGLYVFTRKKFTPVNVDGVSGDDVQYAQAAYTHHRIIVPDGQMYNNFSATGVLPALNRVYHIDRYSILKDHLDKIWYKSGNFVYQLDSNSVKQQFHLPGEVSQIYEDQQHRLLIGTGSQGLWYLDPAKYIKRPVLLVDWLPKISWLQEETPDLLWIGTAVGLFRFRYSTGITDTIPGMRGIYIRSLYIPRPGEVWITTYSHGFYLFSNNKLTAFPLDEEHYLAASHCIVPDDNGFLWITTNKGLFQVARKDLLDYARHPSSSLFYMYYAKDAGFNTNEFNGGCEPCALKLDNGIISLPSMNGLVWFSATQKMAEIPDKGLFIDEVEVDKRKYYVQDTIHLLHNFRQMKLYLSTPYFGNAYNLRLSYALVKNRTDTLWLDVPPDNTIAFSTLASGTYKLYIRKLNGFGIGNYTFRKMVIIVAPAYYETTWFLLLAGLIGILTIYIYSRLYLYNLRKKNIELEAHVAERTRELNTSEKRLRQQVRIQERLVAAITHDIKTPMKYLMRAAEHIFGKDHEKEIMQQHAHIIYDASYRMYHLLDNLIGYMRTHLQIGQLVKEEMGIYELIEGKRKIFEPVAALKNTIISNQVAASLKISGNPRILEVAIHNLVDNAVKHTDNGNIVLSASIIQEEVYICISDTGPGFHEEVLAWVNGITMHGKEEASLEWPLQQGMGLIIVIELLQLIKGRLQIESIRHVGTVVTVILPLH
ncbi:signal transduction histidine kinase [Chitinophaga niastensis]|uniref:histidine kinase n=1 Tax=Chitinophaga niastensis TaxID=536980 RepID=A0A2P8HH68_CHINA|nr:ATP-binding protein [Chitinophaga niastensis]PSL45557.1 signal transduction histidine kinase [Chitinophaga niastensis]